MPVKDITIMVQGDDRVWLDADSITAYLRMCEQQAKGHAATARESGDPNVYVAATAVSDAMRQVADGIVVTCMEAREHVRGRRVP